MINEGEAPSTQQETRSWIRSGFTGSLRCSLRSSFHPGAFANTGTRFGKFIQTASSDQHRRRSLPMPARCIRLTGASADGGAACPVGSAKRNRSTWTDHPASLERQHGDQGRIDQPQSLSIAGVQVWLHRKPECQKFAARLLRSSSRKRLRLAAPLGSRDVSHLDLPMDPTTRARRAIRKRIGWMEEVLAVYPRRHWAKINAC